MKHFKLWPTILAKISIRTVFFVTSLFFPINKKKVTFASYRAEKLEGNLYYVFTEMQNRSEEYSFQFLFKKYHSSITGKLDYFFYMLRAGYHLATSRYFLIDDYYIPLYLINPRKNTEIIQLWHAAGAFKKFGYSTLDHTFGPSRTYLRHVKIHSNYSTAIVSSSEVIPYYSEAFHMPPEQILPLGIPRTDYFFQINKHHSLEEGFYKKYPKLKEKKLILYAPTFRGKSHYQEAFQFPIHIKKLKSILGENYALIVHLHPYMKSKINIPDQLDGFVYHFVDQFNIQELMVLSDILITDYSSVVFDYSLLVKPIAFFANDLDEYRRERDFYYDYQTFIPGPLFAETDKLAYWIKDNDFDYSMIKEFRDRFFDDLDGKSSKRIIDHLINKAPEANYYTHQQKDDKLAR